MSKKHRILIVDDTPANIKVLKSILEDHYSLSVATSGKDALEIAGSNNKPDLILLDIMMPEMDGYEVCQKLKSNSRTAKIPVIFVTAMGECDDESKGFQCGAVDYITKPISPPVTMERIRTHLELKDAKAKVENMFSKTFLGAVHMMSDMMSLTSPLILSRSSRLKGYVKRIARELNLSDVWNLEIAATLSQIGCVTLPKSIVEKKFKNIPLAKKEQDIFNTHPGIGKTLLSNIPSLDVAGKIIERQMEKTPDTDFKTWDFVTIGSQILKVSQEYDELIASGTSKDDAFSILMKQMENYSWELLKILIDTEKARPDNILKSLPMEELKEGMILAENVTCKSKDILIAKDTLLSKNILGLLKNHPLRDEVKKNINVLVSL